jgi:hypothetical protein
MSVRDVPQEIRVKDLFHHIDIGFLNRRLCITALPPNIRAVYMERPLSFQAECSHGGAAVGWACRPIDENLPNSRRRRRNGGPLTAGSSRARSGIGRTWRSIAVPQRPLSAPPRRRDPEEDLILLDHDLVGAVDPLDPRRTIAGGSGAPGPNRRIRPFSVTQLPVSVKGFAQPERVYRVVGIYDELEKDGRIIREERDGFRLLVDLTKGDQASAIAAVENVLARLKG